MKKLVFLIALAFSLAAHSQSIRITVMTTWPNLDASTSWVPIVPYPNGGANFKVQGKYLSADKVDSVWQTGGHLYYRRYGQTVDAGVVSGGGGGVTEQVYTSGTTVTVSSQTSDIWLILNPSSITASLTVTMPATPYDGEKIEMSAGGTITSGVVITSLTIAANTGQTLLQSTIPTQIRAGESVSYRYKSSNTTWYRIL